MRARVNIKTEEGAKDIDHVQTVSDVSSLVQCDNIVGAVCCLCQTTNTENTETSTFHWSTGTKILFCLIRRRKFENN